MALPLFKPKEGTASEASEFEQSQIDMARATSDVHMGSLVQQTPIPTVEYARHRSLPPREFEKFLHQSMVYSFIPAEKVEYLKECVDIAVFDYTFGFDGLAQDILAEMNTILYLYRSVDGNETTKTHAGRLIMMRGQAEEEKKKW